MRYKDYEGWTKLYVLVHNTGTGVMEDNYVEHDVVAEADTMEEAVKISNRLKAENNTPAQVRSTWCNNTYHINVNTLCPDSAPLVEEFNRKADELHQHVKDNPDLYTTHRINGFTFHMRSLPEFENKVQNDGIKIIGGFDTQTGEHFTEKR